MSMLINPRNVSYGMNTEARNSPNVRHAMIERRAYGIWKTKGCPKGTTLQDWLEAEAEVDAAARMAGWCYLCRDPMPVEVFPR